MFRSPSRVGVSAPAAAQKASLEPGDNDAGAGADSGPDDEEEEEEEEDTESSPVPQVMVGPDGNIILNPGR